MRATAAVRRLRARRRRRLRARSYEDVVRELKTSGLRVETGEFQAMMQVALVNDGPVTILLDSRKTF